MKLKLISPKVATKSLIKLRPHRNDLELFKKNLITLLDSIDEKESEEHLKNDLRDFLKNTFYKDDYYINTKDRKDLVIHVGNTNKHNVGVIIEAKSLGNKPEMLASEKPNSKALQELVLYYMNERFGTDENIDIKYCIVTNVHEWYIFDASFFEDHFARNTSFRKEYLSWKNNEKVKGDTKLFYEKIASKHIDSIEREIPVTYFNISKYEKALRDNDKDNDNKLIELYKIFSRYHLLRTSILDSNTLDGRFYKELLHIIGLEEVKKSGKTVIARKPEGKRDAGSLIENAITILQTEDSLSRIEGLGSYGDNKDEQVYNIALELSLTWINRILFLKLLEGQLVSYHKGDEQYKFLNIRFVEDYDELYKLFHQVLAVGYSDRNLEVRTKYSKIPYLNSSLFDISDLEYQGIRINQLNDRQQLRLITGSVLDGKNFHQLPSLDYLFKFLDAYDFASDSKDYSIQEDNKTLINASVLGKVFEKINGYRDGSVYTPGFITMYMCREVIRPTIVKKFKEIKGWDISDFVDLKNYIKDYRKVNDILEFNSIINSIRICDPAVGSGHFLVSALNELIVIKVELGILADKNGARLSGCDIEIANDELIITDFNGDPFAYEVGGEHYINKEVQRLQETLFHEKQAIIENCLFGVDINPNSVKICRLRLWIELLKNAYYKAPHQLETLPNIDINIKCGNSLVSRYGIDEELKNAIDINVYQSIVSKYKNEDDKARKKSLWNEILATKRNIETHIGRENKKQKELDKLSSQYHIKYETRLFEQALTSEQRKDKIKLQKLIKEKQEYIDGIKNNALYTGAFEWRFEFPEILDNNGLFLGFDVIVGNPPYIQLQKLPESIKAALQTQQYKTFIKTGDIYQLFYELGVKLLKPKGLLSYITSNKWMRTDYGSVTRDFLGSDCNTIAVIDFGMAQLFESVTTYTNILILSKDNPTEHIKMCRLKEDYDNTVLLEDYVDFASVQVENPKEKSWIAYDKNVYKLIQKIIALGTPLSKWNLKINRGILTGCNEAFIITTEIRDQIVKDDPSSSEIIKPILRGEDIKSYVPNWANLWLINTHNGIKSLGQERINVEKDHPGIYKWLLKFEDKLKNRLDKGDHWTNLRNCAYLNDFYEPKIIYPNMTKFMPFVYDKHQFFTNQKCFIITGEHLGYLTAFLNSKIFRFAFKDYFPELLGDTRELSKVFFETITIRTVNETTNKDFEYLVDRIEEMKTLGKPIQSLEQQIEEKLYQIYTLTEEDISLLNSTEKRSEPNVNVISNLSSPVSS
ncbi:MAG: class I SAM-dependent DNA methyltransferase [Bacteroidetes bacterium]|nr:class I SAM-dependent DNA methyltransferase [Bacteroidota bacterium]